MIELFTAPFKDKSRKGNFVKNKKFLLHPPNTTCKYFNEALVMKWWYVHDSEQKTFRVIAIKISEFTYK